MINRLKGFIVAAVLTGGILVPVFIPNSASAAIVSNIQSVSDCSQNFLTFPTWYRGLVITQPGANGLECVVEPPDQAGGIGPFIWHIVLNVIEIGLQIVAYLTAGFILWGGFQFLTSQGEPDAAKKARQTILNAVIGLGISIAAIAIVNLLSGILVHT